MCFTSSLAIFCNEQFTSMKMFLKNSVAGYYYITLSKLFNKMFCLRATKFEDFAVTS